MKKVQILLIFCLMMIALDATTTDYHLRGSYDLHDRFGSRTRSSSKSSGGLGIFGFIAGPILFFLSFVVIWNNERKAAIDYRRL